MHLIFIYILSMASCNLVVSLSISVYKTLKEACEKHPDVDVLVNFASLRSAYDVTLEAIKIDQLRTIAIIAEG